MKERKHGAMIYSFLTRAPGRRRGACRPDPALWCCLIWTSLSLLLGCGSQMGASAGVATMFDTAWGELNNWFFEHPGSEHPGGAQFTMADGSVRFISENVDSTTFFYMGSRADGEVITLP